MTEPRRRRDEALFRAFRSLGYVWANGKTTEKGIAEAFRHKRKHEAECRGCEEKWPYHVIDAQFEADLRTRRVRVP